ERTQTALQFLVQPSRGPQRDLVGRALQKPPRRGGQKGLDGGGRLHRPEPIPRWNGEPDRGLSLVRVRRGGGWKWTGEEGAWAHPAALASYQWRRLREKLESHRIRLPALALRSGKSPRVV